MALKITTQIGTDKGITSEAYVRIADYQISKYGSANFRIEVYQSQADVAPVNGMPGPMNGSARNQQIGENLYVPLNKEVDKTITTKQWVPVQHTTQIAGPNDEHGNPTTVDQTTTVQEQQDVEQTIKVTVPDLSAAEASNIFEFGYSHLKTKLSGLFGAEHVVDC
jgi:hypothetical protein